MRTCAPLNRDKISQLATRAAMLISGGKYADVKQLRAAAAHIARNLVRRLPVAKRAVARVVSSALATFETPHLGAVASRADVVVVRVVVEQHLVAVRV